MEFFVDTHAHVYADKFDKDRADMLARAQEAGVGKIYMPNIDHTTIDAMLELESRYPDQCIAMMGLHPCYVKKGFERELYQVETWLAKRKFVAVGEIGTDLYWDKTLWEEQVEAFRIQVNWAKQYQLPIIIHCRESMDQTIALVEELQDGKLKGIFHGFGGTPEQAQRITKLGFLLGIGGVVTYKNSGLDQALPGIILDNLVLETDAPYLAPIPHRGKRNEPSYIPVIASRLAEIKGCTVEDIRRATTRNALTLFKFPSA